MNRTAQSSWGLAERRPAGKADSGERTSPRPPETDRRASNEGLGWRSPHAIVGTLCALAIAFGWSTRGELDLSPSDGLGYGLGIAGLSMMTLLLGYSVRKRARLLRGAGPMRSWFEAHLVLGLLGPTVILYHSDFGLGSANATISLACVLAVSGSGIGGRFLYGRMHRGLAGERRSTKEIQKQARAALVPVEGLLERCPAAGEMLADFVRRSVDPTSGLFRSLRALALRPRARLIRRRVLRSMQEANPETFRTGSAKASVAPALAESLSQTCRAGELVLFEQLFALWHAIHIPLTVILFVSAAIHVLAVHLY